MIDIRSSCKRVNYEFRRHPRLELHCDAAVQGLGSVFTVTDISLGGVFIEPKKPVIVTMGQIKHLFLQLPEEERRIQVKVKFVNQNKRGIGCEFVGLSIVNTYLIDKCIDDFRHTLPIRSDDAVQHALVAENMDTTIVCPQCKTKKHIKIPQGRTENLKANLRCSCGHSWMIHFR